jgi:hypothetical protein
MTNETQTAVTIETLAEQIEAKFIYHVQAHLKPISDASEIYNYHHALAYEKILQMMGYSEDAIAKLWQK